MNHKSNYLIVSLALVSFFFVFPDVPQENIDTSASLALLVIAAAGILLSRIFILASDNRDSLGIESAVIVFLATWNNSFLIYPVTLIMAFSGSILNSIRMERNIFSKAPKAVFQGVSFAFLLKFCSYFYLTFLRSWSNSGAIHVYLALIAMVIPVTILRYASIYYFRDQQTNPVNLLKKRILLNTFILLLAVPSTLEILREATTTRILISCTFGLFSMLVIHGINLKQNRSAHEKIDELETVLRLKELSGNLLSASSEMEALRILCAAVSAAWDCRAAVQWRSLMYFNGKKWNTANAVKIQHSSGLSIWVDSFNSTIPMYMESFLNRTVPVLTGLDAENRMRETSWKSMEAMISFVERNNSDFAGFSRKVANTSIKLSRSLGADLWFEDCMRLAGLLHMISLPDDDAHDYPHALPEITQQALEYMREHWSGSGSAEKTKDEIPLPARILAVSIAWEKAMQSGTNMAVRDMHMRSGTLYDPKLAELIIHINS